MIRALPVLICLAALLSGCAAPLVQPKPPEVQVTALRLINVTMAEQRLSVDLRLSNPNPYPLRIESVQFDLEINEAPLMRGVSADGARVPARGEAELTVDAHTNLFSFLHQMERWRQQGDDHLTYVLTGTANLGGLGRSVDFESAGEFRLQDLVRSP